MCWSCDGLRRHTLQRSTAYIPLIFRAEGRGNSHQQEGGSACEPNHLDATNNQSLAKRSQSADRAAEKPI